MGCDGAMAVDRYEIQAGTGPKRRRERCAPCTTENSSYAARSANESTSRTSPAMTPCSRRWLDASKKITRAWRVNSSSWHDLSRNCVAETLNSSALHRVPFAVPSGPGLSSGLRRQPLAQFADTRRLSKIYRNKLELLHKCLSPEGERRSINAADITPSEDRK